MPRIPQIESTVQTTPVNPGRIQSSMPAQSTAGWDALAKGFGTVADSLVKEGRYEAEKAATLEREKELVNAQTAWNLYEQDALQSISTNVGKKAYEPADNEQVPPVTPTVQINSDSLTQLSKIKDGLADESAKVAFEKWAQPQRINLVGKSAQHAIAEKRKDDTAALEQNIQQNFNLVAKDPSQFGKVITDITSTVNIYGETLGLSKDDRDKVINNSRDHVYGIVFDKIMQTNPVSAKTMFDILKENGDLGEKVIAKFEEPIEVKYQTNQISALPEGERDKALAAIKNSDVKHKVTQEINVLEANETRHLNEVAGTVIDREDKKFRDGKTPLESRQQFINRIYAELPAVKQREERSILLHMYDAELSRRKPAGTGGKEEGDKEFQKEVWRNAIQTQILRGNVVDASVALQWAKEGKIPKAMVTDARQLIEENAKDPSVTKFVTDFAQEKKSNFGGNKEKQEEFERNLSADVRSAQAVKGGKLTDDEKRAIGKRRLEDTSRGWFEGKFDSNLSDTYSDKYYGITEEMKKGKYKPTVVEQLVLSMQNPKGEYVATYGKQAMKNATYNASVGMVQFSANGKDYVVGMDGKVLQKIEPVKLLKSH